MKRFGWAFATVAILAAGSAAAEPVAGVWQTEPGDTGSYAHVTIAPCGANVCGTLGKAFAAGGAAVENPNEGRQMVWDMKARGDGTYRGGKIWAPDRDKTYNARMELAGDKLTVEGCVLGICRGQTWTRVK